MEIRYTLGLNATDNRPREIVAPDFDAFEQQVRNSAIRIGVTSSDSKQQLDAKKRRLPYLWQAYVAGKAQGGLRRCAECAGDLYFMPLDLDGTTAEGWHCIMPVLAAYRGFAYTTASHLHPTANGEHRIRVVLAVSRAILRLEKKRLLQAAQAQIMSIVDLVYDGPASWDSCVYDPAQVIFVPDERAEFWSFDGKPVDVDALLANSPLTIEPQAKTPKLDQDDFEHAVALDAVNDSTFDDLRSAMWHPSVHADAEAACGRYGSWIAMGNRLAWFIGSEFEDRAREMWLAWSEEAPGGDRDAAAAKWDEGYLTADRTGYQAIFARAAKEGWVNPGAERLRESSVAAADDFEALPPDEEEPPRSLPHAGGYGRPGRFIVEGLIPEGVTMVYGASSSFKSYFVLSLGCRLAKKTHRWGGRNLKGGAVLYVAAEGGSSINPRLGAWTDRYNEGKPLELFYTLPLAVDLSVSGNVRAMVNEIKRIMAATGNSVRMVVLDTLSQSMMQGDENSAGDMAKFMSGATKVFTETGASMVIVHHSGKDSSKGMRGSSAGFANADAVIRVDRIDDAVNLINEKQRTGPAQPTRGYSVPIVALPPEVIAANEVVDEEYTSTEGDVYDRVRLETERVFEDIPLAEITPMLASETDKGLTPIQAAILELVENAGGKIDRSELRQLWNAHELVKSGEYQSSSFRVTLGRLKDEGHLSETDDKMIVTPSYEIPEGSLDW
ncbi:AAA family ATPase [Serratia marcescens]|uniref:AAA family ATPase n=1 Tax=Serratia marcescens TaxID=615 RepID=UPI00387A5D1A